MAGRYEIVSGTHRRRVLELICDAWVPHMGPWGTRHDPKIGSFLGFGKSWDPKDPENFREIIWHNLGFQDSGLDSFFLGVLPSSWGEVIAVKCTLYTISYSVSKNRGKTTKSSILIGFGTIIFTIHFGVPLFLETPKYHARDKHVDTTHLHLHASVWPFDFTRWERRSRWRRRCHEWTDIKWPL